MTRTEGEFMRVSFGIGLIAALFSAQIAIADRSVPIVVGDGKLALANNSPVTVTYSVECYDKVTGVNLITGGSNITLAAKGHVEYESPGGCANGSSPTYKSTQGIIACAGSVMYSGASALCGTQSPICTHNVLVTRGVTSLQSFPNMYWFVASTDPWWVTWDNWAKGYSYPTSGGSKTYQPRTYVDSKATSNNRCHISNATGTPGAGIGYCNTGDMSFLTGSGALCCPTSNGFKSCKVTIHSATPQTGHLQSPQFKGGASF
jgi:hypothetical protein